MNKFVIEFEASELDYLGKVLAERPFREVAQLIQKLDQQVRNQVQPQVKEDAS